MSEAGEQLALTGAKRFAEAVSGPDRSRVAALFGSGNVPGQRLGPLELAPVADLIVTSGAIGSLAAIFLGPDARPVRALLLDKSPDANWRLGWHQDRVIAVTERVEVDHFGPWSVKAGQLHVQPPTRLLERMITLRVHVDDVDEGNAPLQIIPGSHKKGRLTEKALRAVVEDAAPEYCFAAAGDVWAYSTLILHASLEQTKRARRRVLQLDYSADILPGGLSWLNLLPAVA